VGLIALIATLEVAALQLQPALSPEVARHLAIELATQAEEGEDPRLSLAIAMQESSLLGRQTEEDRGLFQIHVGTARAFGIDLEKLDGLRNLRKQVKAHLLVLRTKRAECARLGEESWTCYHSRTPHFRLAYRHATCRWLRELGSPCGRTQLAHYEEVHSAD
jgi:hypothetical protein